MNLTPYVIEKTSRGERSYDIYSRLLQDRIILIFGEINDLTSATVIAQMLYLESVSTDPIYVYINSPGGSVTSGLAIYDVINYIKCEVITIGMGLCASLGAFLLATGDKRYALENTKIMIPIRRHALTFFIFRIYYDPLQFQYELSIKSGK